MSTYTTNTKPESKFEDVPEEVLTDPTMRTALGMDPIPGMNTPVDAADDICSFVNEHSGLNLKATPVNGFIGSSNSETASLTLLEEQRFLHKTIRVFGTVNNPLFLARDVAEWIEHKDVTSMLRSVDEDEKVKIELKSTLRSLSGGSLQANTTYSFLTEDGLYEVLMLSRKPQAKPFKKKVKEILKSIRKNGAYIRNQESMTPEQLVAAGLIAAQKIIESKEKEIALLNGRCGLLTQTVDEKQETINAISRNVPAPTKRMILNRVMKRKSKDLIQNRWAVLYREFENINHMNLNLRIEKYNKEPNHKKCPTKIDYIDNVLGKMDELYDLAVKLFESDFTQLMQEMHLLRMTDEEYEDEEYWKRVL
jgi:prophage antirepressor-like protein|nr:MAG: antirepressor protein KilAC domain [Bacteriophage sp.]